MLVREAHIACIMTSFNKINGVFAGGSKDLCTHILREEWGFDGAVVTDWGDMDVVVNGADADPQDSWKGEIEVWEKKSTKQLKIQAS